MVPFFQNLSVACCRMIVIQSIKEGSIIFANKKMMKLPWKEALVFLPYKIGDKHSFLSSILEKATSHKKAIS